LVFNDDESHELMMNEECISFQNYHYI